MLPLVPGSRSAPTSDATAREMVTRSTVLTSLAFHARRRDWARLVDVGRRGNVLVMSGGHEWHAALSELRRAGWRPVFVAHDYFRPPARARSMHAATAPLPLRTTDLTIGGIDCAELLEPRLIKVSTRARELLGVRARLDRLARRHDVAAVLRGSNSTSIAYAVDRAARTRGIPVLAWQHGMISDARGISQFRNWADGLTADRVLAWGERVAAAYERTLPRDSIARSMP